MQDSSIPIRNKEIIYREIENEVILLDFESGRNWTFNKSAGEIWSLIDGTNTINDIVHELTNIFDVDYQNAKIDVERLINSLVEYKLVHISE